jgi:hypothetical protein
MTRSNLSTSDVALAPSRPARAPLRLAAAHKNKAVVVDDVDVDVDDDVVDDVVEVVVVAVAALGRWRRRAWRRRIARKAPKANRDADRRVLDTATQIRRSSPVRPLASPPAVPCSFEQLARIFQLFFQHNPSVKTFGATIGKSKNFSISCVYV